MSAPEPTWDDEGCAALDECVLDELELFAEDPKGPRTFAALFIALRPYAITYRQKGTAGRMVVYLDDDPESRSALVAALARLAAAGFVEKDPEKRYAITFEGRHHLRALHES
jgi:hypothetical protein